MKKKTNIIKTLFLSMVCSITIGLQSCGDYLDVEESVSYTHLTLPTIA